jgi:DNA-binding transcriptional ArsR family regulator
MQPAVLRAVASPRRRQILRLVWDAELPAGAIAAHFDVSWPAISQNLRVLREAGLVAERRQGTSRLYRAQLDTLGPLASVVQELWANDLERLRELSELDTRAEPRP